MIFYPRGGEDSGIRANNVVKSPSEGRENSISEMSKDKTVSKSNNFLAYLRPDIVLLNEPLPIMSEPIRYKCNLIAIFGTSLQVPGLKDRITAHKIKENAIVVLINRELVKWNVIDYQYIGTIESFMTDIDSNFTANTDNCISIGPGNAFFLCRS